MESISVAAAAARLGVSRSRVYALLHSGRLEDVGDAERVRVSVRSLERWADTPHLAGVPLAPASAWALLALPSGDAAFRAHVGGLLTDPDRARAKARLAAHGLVALAPRLRSRSTVRRFTSSTTIVDAPALRGDPTLVLAGGTAAVQLGWLPEAAVDTVDAYVPEGLLVSVLERHALLPDADGCVVLRSVPEPWPFPPQTRLAPAVVVALDLHEAAEVVVQAVGDTHLTDFAGAAPSSWRARPPRRRLAARPGVSGAPVRGPRARLDVWDDRAEQDARQLVALLFVAGEPLTRRAAMDHLRVSPARLGHACAVLRAGPLFGLLLQEDGESLTLVSAPDCAAVVERFRGTLAPEPLSEAALQVLAIVAYQQPVTRADVSHTRGVDSDAVIATLVARGLLAEDPRFGGRGRPAFLVTTAAFLQQFGLGSLADLPPLTAPEPTD